jgi:hypothetical protein
MKREKKEENSIGDYKLDLLLDSHVRNHRFYRLFLEVVPEAKNIKAFLSVERKDDRTGQEKVELLDGLLTLKHGDSDNELDYDVDLHLKTYTQKEVHLYGHLEASLFKSNLDLSLEFTNTSYNQAINIDIGHHFDGSSKTNSYLELGARLPNTRLDHGVKLLFKVDLPKMEINYLELQLSTPKSSESPYSVFISRTYDLETGVTEYEAG